ncbi:hypothetical protein ST37_16700 [Vibrio sp. qd031]|nr:hypothetical protein ST37_16700 [Vibrio sp. qd031]
MLALAFFLTFRASIVIAENPPVSPTVTWVNQTDRASMSCSLDAMQVDLLVPETDVVLAIEFKPGMTHFPYQDEWVRGNVTVHSKNCVMLYKDSNQPVAVFPFMVTTQGSGVFHYLALGTVQQLPLEGQWLGDRIEINQITLQESPLLGFTATVLLLDRGEEQSFSEPVTLPKEKVFSLNSQEIAKTQLQPSSNN